MRIVRFVASRISPVLGWVVNSVKPKAAKERSTSVVSLDGGFRKRALDGYNRFVPASKLVTLRNGVYAVGQS